MFHNSYDIIRKPVNNIEQLEDQKDIKYKCDMCDAPGWTSETETALHAKKIHKEQIFSLVMQSSNKNLLCLVCLTKQSDSTSLVSHWKTAHLLSSPTALRVEREIFICDLCGDLFFNKLYLQAHIQRMHDFKTHSIECPKCHRNVKSKFICHHLVSHRALRLSSCPICFDKCSSIRSLHNHIANVHRKHLFCNICRFQTTREDIFNAHVKKYGERKGDDTMKKMGSNYKCTMDYMKYFLKFRPKSSWKHSVRRYSLRGLVLYNNINICVLCRHICHKKSQMKIHIKRDHRAYDVLEAPKQNVHKCGCGEVFNNAVLLKQHVFKMKHRDYTADSNQKVKNASNNPES